MTALRKQGRATVPAALMEAMGSRLGLSATASSDEDVVLALGACARTGYIADPHTGTGLAALLRTGTQSSGLRASAYGDVGVTTFL
jgi:threonine synthase